MFLQQLFSLCNAVNLSACVWKTAKEGKEYGIVSIGPNLRTTYGPTSPPATYAWLLYSVYLSCVTCYTSLMPCWIYIVYLHSGNWQNYGQSFSWISCLSFRCFFKTKIFPRYWSASSSWSLKVGEQQFVAICGSHGQGRHLAGASMCRLCFLVLTSFVYTYCNCDVIMPPNQNINIDFTSWSDYPRIIRNNTKWHTLI